MPAKMSAPACLRQPADFTAMAPTKPSPAFHHDDMLNDCTAAPHAQQHCARDYELEHASPRTGAGPGLRQIETEMHVVDLSSRVSNVEAGIAELKASVAFLADEVADHEECIAFLATMAGKVNHDVFPVRIRGGRASRDSNEELVYENGGYTSRDQMDEHEDTSGSNAMAASVHDATRRESIDTDTVQINELRQQIEHLEQQVRRLRGTLRTERGPSEFEEQEYRRESDERNMELAEDLLLHGASTSSRQPIPPRLPDYDDLATQFHNTYAAYLPHNPTETCTQRLPSACTDASTSVASMLQLRNRFLERELTDYEDMCESLLRDVQWQIGAQVELEDRAETAGRERDAAVAELWACHARLEAMVQQQGLQSSSVNPFSGFPESAVEEVEGEEEEEEEEEAAADIHTVHIPSPSSTTTTTTPTPSPDPPQIPNTSFTYLPRQSLILFPGSPPHLFRFADGTTLSRIHAVLHHRRRRRYVGEDNPYLARARDILDSICAATGRRLEDVFDEDGDEVVVRIPEGEGGEDEDLLRCENGRGPRPFPFPFPSSSSASPPSSANSIAHEFDPPVPGSAYDDRGNKRYTPWWDKRGHGVGLGLGLGL